MWLEFAGGKFENQDKAFLIAGHLLWNPALTRVGEGSHGPPNFMEQFFAV